MSARGSLVLAFRIVLLVLAAGALLAAVLPTTAAMRA
jgi:hypothetical protein